MKQQTAVEWLIDQLQAPCRGIPSHIIEQAKAMEKEQMIGFAEYVAGYPDKNRNYLGQMLHARSKYDEANRTVDLLEQYYNETYNK
jgi:hypothetical protein